MPRSDRVRVSREFNKEIILRIKARYMLAGKKPPTSAEITRKIAKNRRIQRELESEFIPL